MCGACGGCICDLCVGCVCVVRVCGACVWCVCVARVCGECVCACVYLNACIVKCMYECANVQVLVCLYVDVYMRE